MRVWLPTLVAIASGAVAAVLLLWPHGKPTNTVQFWGGLIGAPLVACALVFGPRLNRWERHQTNAEETEREHERLRGMWRDWSRRHLRVVDAAAFVAATNEIDKFGEAKIDLPSNKDRIIEFRWAMDLSAADRRRRLLQLVAERFSDALLTRSEIFISLMLDDVSLKQAESVRQQAKNVFGELVPGVVFNVEAQSATDGAPWITERVDRIETTTRLVIAAQFWADKVDRHSFSEGAAAFLIEPGASAAGSIFRPMTSARNTLEADLEQIKQYQAPAVPLTQVWFAGCEDGESTAIRSALTADPKKSVVERLLDGLLGVPGPVSGWIALAIAMEAMRGGGPQLVAWREPESESLHLCTVSPLPQKEAPV